MRHIKQRVLQALARFGQWAGGALDRPCRPEACRRILVFQAGGIGDILRIFPVIQSLLDRFPQASVTTLTPFADTVFQLFPRRDGITRTLPYDVRGDHRGLRGKLALARTLRSQGFDLVINSARGEGMLENTILSFTTGAPCRVGFEKDGAGFLNTVKVHLDDHRALLHQNLDLLRAIGIEPAAPEIAIHIPEEDARFAAAFVRERLAPDERLIALHPGSFWRKQLQWPLPRYAALARELLHAHPCRILLLGAREEAPLTRAIAEASQSPRLIDLAGQTSLPRVAALLGRLHLFIGNDSGLLHLALALKVPSIGLFGYTSPRQVIDPAGPCIALQKPARGPRYLHQPFFTFDQAEPNPIESIEVPHVLEAAVTLLRSPPSRP